MIFLINDKIIVNDSGTDRSVNGRNDCLSAALNGKCTRRISHFIIQYSAIRIIDYIVNGVI